MRRLGPTFDAMEPGVFSDCSVSVPGPDTDMHAPWSAGQVKLLMPSSSPPGALPAAPLRCPYGVLAPHSLLISHSI